MAKGREEHDEQGHETGIQSEEVVVGVLPFFTCVLRRFDKQLVLFEQVILIFFAVFLRLSTLQSAWHLSVPLDQRFQIVPSPFVNFVAILGCRWLVAGLIRASPKEKIRDTFFLSDLEFGANAGGGMGVLTADDDHLPAFLDSLSGLLLPIASEGLLH